MRWQSSSQGEKTSSSTCYEGGGSHLAFVCVRVCLCVCVPGLGGFLFQRPWDPKLGIRASSSKVDKIDQEDQRSIISMIDVSRQVSRATWAEGEEGERWMSEGWFAPAQGRRCWLTATGPTKYFVVSEYLYNARRFTIDLMISMWALKFCPDFLKT